MNNSPYPRLFTITQKWAGLFVYAVVSVLLLAGCDRQSVEPQTDALATWDNDEITAIEFDRFLLKKYGVELSLPELPEDRQAFLRDELQELALNRLWQQESINQSLDDTPEFLRLYRTRMREATVQAILKKNSHTPPAEDEEALRRLFESQLEQYEQPERRVVYNLFIKAKEGRKVEDCRERAEELRTDIRDFYGFQAAARQYSDSETRQSGGLVGLVTRDRLSADLAGLIFSMEANQVSPVVKSKTGAHLFFVTEILPAVVPEFSQYRRRLHRDVVADHLEQKEKELIAQLANVAVPKTPEREEFGRLMSLRRGDPVVLDIGDYQLHRRELKESLRSDSKDMMRRRREGADSIDLAWSRLQEIARHEQIFQSMRISDPELLAELAEEIKPEVRLSLIADRKTAAWLTGNQALIEDFFKENIGEYQRSELLRIRTLVIPMLPPVADQVVKIDNLLNDTPQSETLERLAGQFGIDLEPAEWVERERLFKLLPRLANQIDALVEGDISRVYAVGDNLAVSQLLGRKRPPAPDYSSVKGKVEANFRSVHLQNIYGELKQKAMRQSGFIVHSARLKEYIPGVRITSSNQLAND